jgi:hypothetical protein
VDVSTAHLDAIVKDKTFVGLKMSAFCDAAPCSLEYIPTFQRCILHPASVRISESSVCFSGTT